MTSSAFQMTLTVNGERSDHAVRPRLLLSELLRDTLRLTGTHVGCGTGACGSCTVLLDGEPVRSCLTLAVQADGSEVETIESVGTPEALHPVQAAFNKSHALQCGFCTPGFIMSAVALFRRSAKPSGEQIDSMLQGHLCRCTGYRNIKEALRSAAETAEA
ncbi:(2Fe-2S)-binding protein [Hansschlegelia quercus]|uniref:(2Fe-2S)-binding protein n=1 Tax=Hansschlegelia quercus TaxID=2528245 RepID=A0A4Q9GTS7_9HYPH|nr:(2Fe-2S)-binding protein [Hansschlegelia quercus]TBN55227.1 (2Fe-2S)-binding protein [Hansschlegelia quercus]